MAIPIMADCYLCGVRRTRADLHSLPITRRPADSDRPESIFVCRDANACQVRRNQRTEARAAELARVGTTADAH